MPIIQLTFNYDLNISIQKGDTVYYAKQVSGQSGTNHPNAGGTNTKPQVVGVVDDINHGGNSIQVDNTVSMYTPISGDYLMFNKNKVANLSGITGYFAETEYRNYSKRQAEMFATAVDYVESSK